MKRKQVQAGLKKSKWSEESSPWGKNPTPGSFCATILSVVGDGHVCWQQSTSSSNSSIELEGASLLKSAKKASVQWRHPRCSCLTEKGWHESLGWSGNLNGLTKPEELGLQAFRKRIFDWERATRLERDVKVQLLVDSAQSRAPALLRMTKYGRAMKAELGRPQSTFCRWPGRVTGPLLGEANEPKLIQHWRSAQQHQQLSIV